MDKTNNTIKAQIKNDKKLRNIKLTRAQIKDRQQKLMNLILQDFDNIYASDDDNVLLQNEIQNKKQKYHD